ncbi:MAG: ATP-binding cassette domain-containing protein [Ruminococcaceae bacterium]|nr:ATP-binding cassette domain-containing protein [Oscillospiraceae bacterium]
MNAIEITGLTKNFGPKQALAGLDMTVPKGAIYGFLGENGSGKSTTEKILCGLVRESGGSVRIFGKPHTDSDVRSTIGVLIESPGCFPNMSVWENMMLQAANLGCEDAKREVTEVLKLVHMEGSASNKYKNCSLGMKQRIGIAMALLGDPALLVLDEPINGLDADGMRIVREVLVELAANHGVTVLVSSHILGELEKIATHYGIIRGGKMLREMSAAELDASCRTYTTLRTRDQLRAQEILAQQGKRADIDESGALRAFDTTPAEVAAWLYAQNLLVGEIAGAKISLEEYYTDLMKEGR